MLCYSNLQFTDLLEKECHIFTYSAFFIKQITLGKLIFLKNDICKDKDNDCK